MANSRLPHEFTESIIHDDAMPPIHRVLHWYYRNMNGWKERMEAGELEIKSFTKEAEKIGMSKQVFCNSLKTLEEMGYFTVLKNNDKKCHIILLHSVIKNYDERVLKKYYKLSYKNRTRKAVSPTLSMDYGELKQYLKQFLKAILNNNGDGGVKMDKDLKEINDKIKTSKWFANKSIMQFSRIIYDHGKDKTIYAIEQMNKMEKLPCPAMRYIHGVLRNYDPDEQLEQKVNTPKETKEFEAHLIELPKLIEKFGNNGVPEHKEHLEFIEQCKSVRETQDYFDISFIKQKNKQLTEIAEIYIEMRKKC